MVVALATLHPLPPSELAALILMASKATKISIVDNNEYLGVNPGGRTGAAGLLVDPSLPDGQAAILLHHLVVYPLVDALSVKQENGLDVPPFGHWWAVNIHTYIHPKLLVHRMEI